MPLRGFVNPDLGALVSLRGFVNPDLGTHKTGNLTTEQTVQGEIRYVQLANTHTQTLSAGPVRQPQGSPKWKFLVTLPTFLSLTSMR